MQWIDRFMKQQKSTCQYLGTRIFVAALFTLLALPLYAAITETGAIGIPAATTATSVIVNGDIAYLLVYEGMYTVDITDPTDPDTIHYMDAALPGWADVSITDSWLYLT